MSYMVLEDPPVLFQVSHSNSKKSPSVVLRALVPTSLQHTVINQIHDSQKNSHLDYNKWADIIKRHFVWKGMDKQIQDHIGKCSICHKTKSALPQQRWHYTPKFDESNVKVGDLCYWRRPAIYDQVINNKFLMMVDKGPYRVVKQNKQQVFLEDASTQQPLGHPVGINQIIKPTIFRI